MKLLAGLLFSTAAMQLSSLSSAQIEVAFPAWDPDPVTATHNIQVAIGSGADVVVLNNPPGSNAWVIRTVRLTSDQEVQFAPGLVIKNDPNWVGQTPGSDIFHALGTANSAVRGNAANPARIEFTTSSPITTTYQGHCVELAGCSGASLENLILTSDFGDGITLNQNADGQVPCQDVTISNCVSTGCARAGLAITNAQDVLVEDCQFIGTGLASPASPPVGWGVDIEADHQFAHLSGIALVGCQSSGNRADGFRVWLKALRSSSPAVDVVLENCHVEANEGAAYQVNCDLTYPTTGTVRFEECTANDVDGPGAIAILSVFTTPFSLKVVFDRCHWTAVAKDVISPFAPIYLATTAGAYTSSASGVDFLNCVLDDDEAREPVAINSGPPYTTFYADILGRLTVHNQVAVHLSPSLLPNLLVLYLP